MRSVVAALREESRSGLSDAALGAFLSDAAGLEDRYRRLLSKLASRGTRVVRYGDDPQPSSPRSLAPA